VLAGKEYVRVKLVEEMMSGAARRREGSSRSFGEVEVFALEGALVGTGGCGD